MARFNREEIDRYFDYGIFAGKRVLYLGSLDYDDKGDETGVDFDSFRCFIKGITYLSSISQEPIVIQMSSVGGDFYHGMAMYDAIRSCPCHITIIVYGYACSMGSIILQAGDERIMAPNAVFMMHDGEDYISGSPKTVERWAKYGQEVRNNMYKTYLVSIKKKKPRFTLRQVEELCSHDTILTAKEAVEMGLADRVLDLLEKAGESS